MSGSKQAASFTVELPSEVYNRWDELGLELEQRNCDIDSIKSEINKIVNNYLETLNSKCESTKEEIEEIKASQRKAMKAFGISEDEIQQTLFSIQPINLLQQLSAAKVSYENFKALCADRLKKFETIVHVAGQLFDTLGTPINERGEFNEIGETDYSRERLDRFKCKVEELKQEIEKRKETVAEIRKDIDKVQKEICFKLTNEEKEVYASTGVSSDIIEKNKALLEKLKAAREERVATLNALAVRMLHLWCLLEVPEAKRTEFVKKYATISDEALAACQDEIAKLEKERDEKLPSLMQQQKEELESLYATLHISVEGRMIFDDDCTDKQKIEEQFQQLENEIIRLKDIAVEIHPILVTIQELEEIEKNYEEVQKEHDPKSYTSRDRSCALQLMKEEKARRRYKVIRPKVQKKLIGLLTKYKEEKGVDFEWDGYPYIEKLQEEENNEKIRERFGGVITGCGSVPVTKKKGAKRNENVNQAQYAASLRPASARRAAEPKRKIY